MKPSSFIPFPILLIFLFPTVLVAQQNMFTSVFYDATPFESFLGYSLIETSDSNYLIVGEHQQQPMILKMDKDGQMVWNKSYDFGNYSSIFTRIIPTNDSCYMAAGTILPSSAISDFFCMKFKADGDTLLTRSYDFGNDEIVTFITQTSDQGFILSGHSSYFSTTTPYIAVLKLSGSGDVEWSVKLTIGAFSNCAHVVKEMPDSGFMVAGHFTTVNYDDPVALMIRLTSSGNVVWAKKLNIPEASHSTMYDVLLNDSTLICYIDANEPGTILLSVDLSGNILWSKTYFPNGGWSCYNAEKPKFHRTPDNGFIFVLPGQFNHMLKVDSLGNAQWQDWLLVENVDVIPTYDAGYLVLGNGPLWGVEMAPTLNPQTGLIKTDSLGNSDDCMEWSLFWHDTIQVEFEPVLVDTGSGVITTTLHSEIYEMPVWTHNGCVAMTGSIDDGNPEIQQLVVSPNPSDGHVQINLKPESESLSTFDVYNSTGQRVYHSNARVHLPAEIDFSFFPDGIYFILATLDGKRYSKKLIISR